MRYILPMVVGLLGVGCALPRNHDAALNKHPHIPYQEEAISRAPLSDGSLWQDRQITSDLRARRLNDLVTIRISENTSAVSKADVAGNRSGSTNLKAPSLGSRLSSLGIESTGTGTGAAANSYSTNTSNTYKGAGSTDRSATFTTTITTRVVRVLGNGNLIVEGFRDIQLNNETQRLYIAGMVEPVRLDVNNSIASNQVAELRLGYGGQGVVDETLKPGYISRLLNYIWPF